MELKIIDNFLSENEFDDLRKNTIHRGAETPFIIVPNVAFKPSTEA